ncbi:MAG: hypothetical protein RR946_01085 [Clostridia bacterium]
MRTAVIGIGSNSLRMLVADITNGRLHRLRRYREGLRVFAALDDQGNITQDMIDMACKSVDDFRNEALAQGAEQLCLFATSAVRDARNQQVLISALEKTTGLELDICSGEQEALLSFIGATEGQRTGMIDIGGGSTEIVVGYGKEMLKAVSLQMGAVRLCRKQPINSVATAEEVVKTAESMLLPYQESFLALNAENWVGVGGTFTTSAAFVQKIPLERRDSIHGFVLTQKRRSLFHGTACAYAHGTAASIALFTATACGHCGTWHSHFTCVHERTAHGANCGERTRQFGRLLKNKVSALLSVKAYALNP